MTEFESQIWTMTEILNQLEVGDFDNDGDVDLATIDTAVNPSVVVLLENDGAASFTTLRQDFSGDSLACGDLDGDGDLDLTIATSSQLELRLNDGSGDFESTILFSNNFRRDDSRNHYRRTIFKQSGCRNCFYCLKS